MAAKSQIFLRISEIASFLGQNRYSFIEPFERLIKQIDPKSRQSSVNALQSLLEQKEIELQVLYFERDLMVEKIKAREVTPQVFAASMKEIDRKASLARKNITDTSIKIDDITLTVEQRVTKILGKATAKTMLSSKIDMSKKSEIAVKLIKESKRLPNAKKLKMLKETKTIIATTHGNLKEDSGLKAFEKLYDIKLDTSQLLYEGEYENFAFKSNVTLRGKLDGVYIDPEDPSKNFLVEVKSRTRDFFKDLRDYERTQIQLYCWLLNIENAKLVEKVDDKIIVTEIKYDKDYVDMIFTGIDILISRIENDFLPDKDLIADYYQLDEIGKLKFLKRLYLDEINLMFSSNKKGKNGGKGTKKKRKVGSGNNDIRESSESDSQEVK